jgi:hypothetical protein
MIEARAEAIELRVHRSPIEAWPRALEERHGRSR